MPRPAGRDIQPVHEALRSARKHGASWRRIAESLLVYIDVRERSDTTYPRELLHHLYNEAREGHLPEASVTEAMSRATQEILRDDAA